jgi:RNase H-fold protein (predicted Holliday junction resolvase)
MVAAAGGTVTPEAESVLGEIAEREPENLGLHYYLGLLEAQTGRPDRAFPLWRKVVEEMPEGSLHRRLALGQIEEVAWLAGVDYEAPASPAPPGPTEDEMAATAEMDPAQREEMIRGMVESLASRLASEGGPAADWARLIASLGVLGDAERAQAILTRRAGSFEGDCRAAQAPAGRGVRARRGFRMICPMVAESFAAAAAARRGGGGARPGDRDDPGRAVSDLRRRVATRPRDGEADEVHAGRAAPSEIARARDLKGSCWGCRCNMDGSEGPRAQSTRAFARNLERLTDLPIRVWDERLSTVAAERALLEADTVAQASRRDDRPRGGGVHPPGDAGPAGASGGARRWMRSGVGPSRRAPAERSA